MSFSKPTYANGFLYKFLLFFLILPCSLVTWVWDLQPLLMPYTCFVALGPQVAKFEMGAEGS